jgi:hypothetical protein
LYYGAEGLIYRRNNICKSIKLLQNSVISTQGVNPRRGVTVCEEVSGYRKPSKVNAAFERAVDEVAEATHKLIDSITMHHHIST